MKIIVVYILMFLLVIGLEISIDLMRGQTLAASVRSMESALSGSTFAEIVLMYISLPAPLVPGLISRLKTKKQKS